MNLADSIYFFESHQTSVKIVCMYNIVCYPSLLHDTCIFCRLMQLYLTFLSHESVLVSFNLQLINRKIYYSELGAFLKNKLCFSYCKTGCLSYKKYISLFLFFRKQAPISPPLQKVYHFPFTWETLLFHS